MNEISPGKKSALKKPCASCGAELIYAPGTSELRCGYCGHTETIKRSEKRFSELSLWPYLDKMGSQGHSEEITMLHCKNCGASQHIGENYKSIGCIYCNTPLIIEDAHQENWILPGAVLPFQIDQKEAFDIFKKWVKGLWFAPNNLKKAAVSPENTRGLYLPYWTFDSDIYADYTGERGEYYYVTETVGSGKDERRVQVRKTRWYDVSGNVSGFLDDTLITASNQRMGRIPEKIATWNLSLLKPFDSNYLLGYVTEKYTVPLADGYKKHVQIADDVAHNWAKEDIGGDEQRVFSVNTQFTNETFKHILLPVYLSSYQYNGKRYTFFVNGESGAISGQRPHSLWKIFFFIFFIALILFVIYMASGN